MANGRRVDHNIDLVIEDWKHYGVGDNIWSEKVGPLDGFHSQPRVYPFGRSFEDEHANAYIYVFCGSGASEWSCEQVDFDIICWDVQSLPRGMVVASGPEDFSQESDNWGNDFCPNPDAQDLRFRARISLPSPPETMPAGLCDIDLSQRLTQVAFRFSTGPCLFADKRVLVARSQYFKQMFAEANWVEGRTNEVDCQSDPTMDRRSVHALLLFLMSNRVMPPEDPEDYDYYFALRRLADRCLVKTLVHEVESTLALRLAEGNVLQLLGRVAGSGGPLETACLAMLKKDDCAILDTQMPAVDQIIGEHPELARSLVHMLVAERRSRKRALGSD